MEESINPQQDPKQEQDQQQKNNPPGQIRSKKPKLRMSKRTN